MTYEHGGSLLASETMLGEFLGSVEANGSLVRYSVKGYTTSEITKFGKFINNSCRLHKELFRTNKESRRHEKF